MLGLALLGFLVWGHHMFVSGQSEFATMVFSALTFLVAIPSGVKVFNWTATLYKGSIALTTPMLYALSFLVLFTIGGLTGLFLGTLSVDVHLTDTYFVVAHFHYVMMGGTVMGFLGGLWYWWPKITGKLYREKVARWSWFFVFVGFNSVFLVQFVMGSQGMPRRYYDYLPRFHPYHAFSTVGSWILGVGFPDHGVRAASLTALRRNRSAQSVGVRRIRVADGIAARVGELQRSSDHHAWSV